MYWHYTVDSKIRRRSLVKGSKKKDYVLCNYHTKEELEEAIKWYFHKGYASHYAQTY
jgi:carboxypeptidase C (cathepsin A)